MYKLTEIGFDTSIETAESLISVASQHCQHYEDRLHLLPINTVNDAVSYFNTHGFLVEELQ